MKGVTFSDGSFPSILCPAEIKFHRFAMNNILPSSLEMKDMIISNSLGEMRITSEKKRMTHANGNFIIKRNRLFIFSLYMLQLYMYKLKIHIKFLSFIIILVFKNLN